MTEDLLPLFKDPEVQKRIQEAAPSAGGFLRQAEFFYKYHGEGCQMLSTALNLLRDALRSEGISLEEIIGNRD
jgi:hypothetical protein